MIDVRIQGGDFDPGKQLQRLGELGNAATAGIVGLIEAQDEVTGVTIEHYAAAAKSELTRIAQEAERKWSLSGVIIVHRHGSLAAGDRVLLAAAASSDPTAANEACAYMVAALRARAPFWRKDQLSDGTVRWR